MIISRFVTRRDAGGEGDPQPPPPRDYEHPQWYRRGTERDIDDGVMIRFMIRSEVSSQLVMMI